MDQWEEDPWPAAPWVPLEDTAWVPPLVASAWAALAAGWEDRLEEGEGRREGWEDREALQVDSAWEDHLVSWEGHEAPLVDLPKDPLVDFPKVPLVDIPKAPLVYRPKAPLVYHPKAPLKVNLLPRLLRTPTETGAVLAR